MMTKDKYPDKSFSVFEDLRGFGNLAGLMSDSYLRIYVRVLRTIFIDTNVLVYANLAQSPFHKQATERLQAFSEQDYELWISRQVLREYLAAMTRQNTLTDVIPTASLIEDVRYFSTSFRVAEDGPHVTERLFVLMERIPIGGSQVHDANIVATMQNYGIQHLLTHNVQDFNRFSEIISILPLSEKV